MINLSGLNSPPLVAKFRISIKRYPAACGGEFHREKTYYGRHSIAPCTIFREFRQVLVRSAG